MKTSPAYLIIDVEREGPPRIQRVTQRWPQLEAGEIVVRVRLEIPDDLLPQVQDIVIDDPQAIGVAVEAEPLEIPA